MSENNTTTLTADVVQALLSVSDKQSTALVSALENVRIKSIGSLLIAAEDIRKEGGTYDADGKLSPIDAGFLQDIAALRDKVKALKVRRHVPPSTPQQP